MKTTAQVVVIGGGVVGCSVLYHLTKKGWTDVLLIERDQLTSGSTWHAAGGFHTLNGDPNVAMLQSYTVGLYKELEEISRRAVSRPSTCPRTSFMTCSRAARASECVARVRCVVAVAAGEAPSLERLDACERSAAPRRSESAPS